MEYIEIAPIPPPSWLPHKSYGSREQTHTRSPCPICGRSRENAIFIYYLLTTARCFALDLPKKNENLFLMIFFGPRIVPINSRAILQ